MNLIASFINAVKAASKEVWHRTVYLGASSFKTPFINQIMLSWKGMHTVSLPFHEGDGERPAFDGEAIRRRLMALDNDILHDHFKSVSGYTSGFVIGAGFIASAAVAKIYGYEAEAYNLLIPLGSIFIALSAKGGVAGSLEAYEVRLQCAEQSQWMRNCMRQYKAAPLLSAA